MLPSAAALWLLVSACGAVPPVMLRSQCSALGGRNSPPISSTPYTPSLRGRSIRVGSSVVGSLPADISQFPWQVSLEALGRHVCGGSVISETWLLTAAHCFSLTRNRGLSVRAGTSSRGSGGTQFNVAHKVCHEKHGLTADYDIAVVSILGSFFADLKVKPVVLGRSELSGGAGVFVSGWGDMRHGDASSDQLHAVSMTIVERSLCNAIYRGLITDRMICAENTDTGRDVCHGAGGSPLVEGAIQYGIASWGNGCSSATYPGVYTNVAGLRYWIISTTGMK
ncbi:trypsin delta-like [Schistocerca americana]|uniref:trypsin delta-like n=1 Tax=Schistocerca americana TaxID=7009 RepID=UPI001F4F289D|nr:trypsin delta-like [Schistocerca americana]